MSKFRIVEQRGVFQIQERIVEQPKYKKSWITGNMIKTGLEDIWVILLDEAMMIEDHGLCSTECYAHEFDTYKKAENYIKKFYGSTGVDAIEKPEWTVK
jgi:hypothetical protein